VSALAGATGARPAGRHAATGSGSALALLDRPEERLSALERLEVLTDPGSLTLVRTRASSRRMGERARPGDGIVAGHGSVDGRQVYCYAQDPTFAGGSLGEVQAQTLVQVMQLARRARVPLIGFVESAGARMQEGLAALQGYGEIFREHVRLSGLVPQIAIVCGPSAGGASYGPALNDFVIMSSRASMFLTGPAVVAEVTGEELDAGALGGPRVHERNGVCHLTAPSDVDAALLARDLLDYLPQRAGLQVQRWPTVAAPGGSPDHAVPAQGRKVYDVRDVARALVDGGRLLEISPRWARNVVCALARLDGRAIGILASQPCHLGGVLDAAASQKAARFVRTCNSFGLPLLVLVDTPGFLPGSRQEREGVIRHGAKLVHAFAELTVPSVTVVLRKAYGGAFIAMNSKALGADYYFAWPGAELGVMGAGQAVGILHRREIAAAADPVGLRERLAADYGAQHLGAETALAEGFVDEVIAPSDTRDLVASCLAALGEPMRADTPIPNIPL
jgi:acetyl-CoA carboxylase carboxyltransferase component